MAHPSGERTRMFTLDDLVAERAADPQSFTSRWDVPVLVRGRDVAPQAAEIPLGFHTVTSDRAAIDAALRQTANLGPAEDVRAAVQGQLHRVEKRTGGAFPERIGIGRAPNVDVQIVRLQVSKYHAFITLGDDGPRIADARSTYGTFVDGQKLEPLQPVPLREGATVRLACYEFAFHGPEGLGELLDRRAFLRSSG